MRKLVPLISLFSLLLLAPPIGAQSSPTIDQGVFTVTGISSSTVIQFTLAGPNLLTITGGMRDGNHSPACTPCFGGQSIVFVDLYMGASCFLPGTMNTGKETQPVYFAGTVTIDSAPVTLPFRYNRYPQTIVVPISLRGHLEVHSAPPFGSPHLLFDLPLNLEGKATMRFRTQLIDSPNHYAPQYKILSLIYDFPAPTHTDETKQ